MLTIRAIITRFTVIFCCASLTVEAGVIIFTDVPKPIKQLLIQAQRIIEEELNELNEQPEEQYLFERNCYDPHITLAYVSDLKLSASQLEEMAPNLVPDLAQHTNSAPLEISNEMLQDLSFTVFPAGSLREYAATPFKNYAILVITMKPPVALTSFAQSLNATLANHPIGDSVTEKRMLPFHPHVTIGYLYDTKDVDLSSALAKIKPRLEALMTEFKVIHREDQPHIIESFSLATDDNQHITFMFNERKQSPACSSSQSSGF